MRHNTLSLTLCIIKSWYYTAVHLHRPTLSPQSQLEARRSSSAFNSPVQQSSTFTWMRSSESSVNGRQPETRSQECNFKIATASALGLFQSGWKGDRNMASIHPLPVTVGFPSADESERTRCHHCTPSHTGQPMTESHSRLCCITLCDSTNSHIMREAVK